MSKRTLAIIAGVVVLVAVIAVVAWRLIPRAAQDVRQDAQAQRAGEAEAIEAAKAAIATRAPDATNMTYGQVTVNWVGETPAVCGTVDIEEPQDSFDGPERFVWVDGQVTVEEFEGTDAVNTQWNTVCKSV